MQNKEKDLMQPTYWSPDLRLLVDSLSPRDGRDLAHALWPRMTADVRMMLDARCAARLLRTHETFGSPVDGATVRSALADQEDRARRLADSTGWSNLPCGHPISVWSGADDGAVCMACGTIVANTLPFPGGGAA